MSDDEIWQRWKAKQQNNTSLTPAEYRVIDELEQEIELEWGVPAAPAHLSASLRYPNADLEKLQVEAEELLRRGQAISAADLFEQALLLFEASPQAGQVLKGHLLNGLGLAQYHKGSREEAEYTFGQVLALAKRVASLQLEQEARYGLGLVYLKQRKIALAIDNLRQALICVRQRQERRDEAMILLELGSGYVEQSLLHRAIACLLMAQRFYLMVELFPDYEERKEAERRIENRLEEVRKRAAQVNLRLGSQQYQSWVADFEAGKLLPE
ncbi:MAG: hypothetical protein WCS37_05605 [Chloroflexota bacterium]|nr:hypothetical protein [Chloroflexota bacterium]